MSMVVAIAEHETESHDDRGNDPGRVLAHQPFDFFYLFVFRQEFFRHNCSAPLSPSRPNNAPKRSLISATGHSSCIDSRRSAFTPTTPRVTSSSPTMSASVAPLLSARLNCV